MPYAYLLVRVRVGKLAKAENRFRYPDCYDAQEVHRNQLGGNLYLGEIARGAAQDECLIYVESRLAQRYKRACPGDFKILTEAEADTWLAAHPAIANRTDEVVSDIERLQAIQAKAAAGAPITQDDRDALDPDHPKPGISRQGKRARDVFPRETTRPPRDFTR